MFIVILYRGGGGALEGAHAEPGRVDNYAIL